MAVRKEAKIDLTQLDDLLQCPVCYEVPTDHIYQCNQGHHVCGLCKARLSLCPVCRCLFFGTRNYAMEILISNLKKMRISTSPASSESPVLEGDEDLSTNSNSTQNTPSTSASESRSQAPASCSGVFRCLCCKNGATQRLPIARLLNHLRYFHQNDLVEGRLQDDKYEQSWRISTENNRRDVIAFRIAEMGIFFLVMEIAEEHLVAWLSMAASQEEASKFSFQLTVTCADREASYEDNVKSTRACEGHIKSRLRCLAIRGENLKYFYRSRAVVSRVCVSRLSGVDVSRLSGVDELEPRTAMRIANIPSICRINQQENQPPTPEHRSAGRSSELQSQARHASQVSPRPRQNPESVITNTLEQPLGLAALLRPRAARMDHDNQQTVESYLSRNSRRRMRQQIRQDVEASVQIWPRFPIVIHPPASQNNTSSAAAVNPIRGQRDNRSIPTNANSVGFSIGRGVGRGRARPSLR